MQFRIFLISLLFLACRKDHGTGSLPEQSISDVAYGSDASQKMDVYLPPGRTSSLTKVIIMIHGGGWNLGDKSDFSSFVDTIKQRLPGWAIFNINYRLSTGSVNLFPTQENDTKAALDFIFSKRNEYSISDKFVVLGASAGAHLALLQGYKYSSPVRIKAVVDFFGPVDLIDMYNNPASILAAPAALAAVIGATPTSNPAIYQQSSPINFVTATSPPTILLHGGLDPLVSPAQAQALNTKLQALGVVHQFVFYPGESHGWTGPNLSDSFDKIGLFIAANVN